jgi:sterol desaturase/sphingolipid hydroxylase (fatty acid hydroxylase superfamily)
MRTSRSGRSGRPSGKNIRLFENPVLERLTYVHPALPLLIWGPIALYCFLSGIETKGLGLRVSAAVAAGALFFWTFAEYVLHRFVFHFRPSGKFQERIAFLIHGIHHEDPNDARRLVMPPVAAFILASIFWGIFTLLLGTTYVRPFFAGFLVGYLCYDYIHYAVHFWPVRSRVLLALKKNHMRHHFVTPDKRFGVSNMFWDHVFRTTG